MDQQFPERGWLDPPFGQVNLPLVGQQTTLDALTEAARSRQALAVVTGEAGSGKTRLAHEVAKSTSGRWFGIDAQRHHDDLRALTSRLPSDTALFIVDDVDSRVHVDDLTRVIERVGDMAVIITTRSARLTRPSFPLPDAVRVLQVPPLQNSALIELGEVGGIADQSKRERLAASAFGNPARLIAAMIDAGGSGSLFSLARDGIVDAVIGPDGYPLSPTAPRFQAIEFQVREISDALIARLAQEPVLMRNLDWRRFEELVADLYERDGYEVELTRGSRDRGVDIYAVHRAPHSSFLTVIDCKRYRVGRPVGVELVRQLRSTVADQKAHLGVIATTSHFTRGAKEYQASHEHRLGLQDFLTLHEMLKKASAR